MVFSPQQSLRCLRRKGRNSYKTLHRLTDYSECTIIFLRLSSLLQTPSPQRASQLILAGCRSKDDLLRPKFLNMLPETIRHNVRLASHIEKPVMRQQTEDVAV